MLVTLSDQLYILCTCGITGFFVLSRLYGREDKDRLPGIGSSVVCGLVVLTAYAGYFSLFSGVGLAANIILILACLIFVLTDRKAYHNLILSVCTGIRNTIKKGDPANTVNGGFIPAVKYIIIAFIILVSAYFTSAGRFAYDTGTYHAQSIHWIESYGVVRGLAYMQTRLGFNSSYFCLCALYSMHFLGRSLHTLSGFLASFVMVYSMNGLFGHIKSALDRRSEGDHAVGLSVSDLLYIAPFAYFIITAVEIISPATDFGVIWLILWLCIRWVELAEEEREQERENAVSGYALLCVMAVFLVSVKLSVGVLALLVIKPAYELIRDKKWADIIGYIAAGIILILPYFIRNYFITGWLVYPFPAIDMFSPDWKIPLEGVRHEADEVVVWARYTKDTALIGQGIGEWFPVWWSEQGAANRCLSVSAFTGAVVFTARAFISLIVMCYRRFNDRRDEGRQNKDGSYLYFGFILLICFAFFMVSAPSNRFGYAYILLLPLFAAGDCMVNVIPAILKVDKYADENSRKKNTWKTKNTAVIIFGIAFFIFICAPMCKGIYKFASDDRNYVSETGLAGCAVFPKDYPLADSSSKEWEGIKIYYPVIEGEQIWYHDFPAILYEGNLEGIRRRGDSIKDGFTLK